MTESKCINRRLSLMASTQKCLKSNTWTSPLCLSGFGWTEDKEQHDKALELFHALAENTSCSALFFQNATVDDSLSEVFSKAVCRKQDLRTLALRNLSLPQQDGEASPYCVPSCVFRNHAQLKSLSLTNIKLDEAACLELCQMLRESKELISLSLDTLEIDPQGLAALLAAIATSPSLKTVRFSNMTWAQEDLARMFRAISCNRTITYFTAESMRLDADHAKLVAELLRKNKTITTLCLRRNNLDAHAVKIIVGQGLKFNSAVQALYLSRNKFGNEGAACLANYLTMLESSVQVLCLIDTQISKSGCSMILRSLEKNTSLRSISLDGNDVWELSEQLLSTLDVNTTLTHVLERLPAIAEKSGSQQWKQVEFYLRANKAGRRFLKEESFQATSQIMPQLLRQGAAASPDVFFYFLVESGPARIRPVFSASVEPRTFVPSMKVSHVVKQKSPVPRQLKTIAPSA